MKIKKNLALKIKKSIKFRGILQPPPSPIPFIPPHLAN